MKIGIPREVMPGEKRVAAVPETVSRMIKAGMEVAVESGAGLLSHIEDKDYQQAGAVIASDHQTLFAQADVILKVNKPVMDEKLHMHELDMMKEGTTLIAPLYPARNPDLVKQLIEKKITSFSLDMLPRIARAQSMDILSSMSNLAGYKSVILAADHLGKIFPMLTTAAGTILPAKVIVIGAGVAGLQAIATARRLGGVVIAFDTRPVVAEQVKSLGADFVSLETSHEQSQDTGGYAKEQTAEFYQKEQEIIRQYSREADVIITTALIPGKRAPILITESMVREMKRGSVIVDLAVEQEGNCELSEPGQIIVRHDVTIIGILNIPSTVVSNASQLYSKNLLAFLSYIAPQLQASRLDMTDEIVKGCLVTYQGDVLNAVVKQVLK
ncbi:NAD(P) transhydrogenase subunit alpha part 1 [Aquicella siphonis]|uniref:NAD(P) transhydrogenase subunit alpha part 1 n=1 Tax=Aquicella siphonis TaxID=254247 RepID=A0A5E4PLW4_9COXI|nr:Re/Si-specific NAD(P)(+) transhydrogenase subunit alpha [Aquicella siphonis]VVC77242.1 NAD(P) transhydrogenase subunit alpha part 1 [Aquicella siphonis]